MGSQPSPPQQQQPVYNPLPDQQSLASSNNDVARSKQGSAYLDYLAKESQRQTALSQAQNQLQQSQSVAAQAQANAATGLGGGGVNLQPLQQNVAGLQSQYKPFAWMLNVAPTGQAGFDSVEAQKMADFQTQQEAQGTQQLQQNAALNSQEAAVNNQKALTDQFVASGDAALAGKKAANAKIQAALKIGADVPAGIVGANALTKKKPGAAGTNTNLVNAPSGGSAPGQTNSIG